MKKSIATLLNDVYTKHEQLKESGAYFNIFTALNIQWDERKHSCFIAELLNPRGSHGQGGLFLQSFIESHEILKSKIDYDPKYSVRVETEKNIGTIPENFSKGGYIDIYIEINGKCIIIENKVNAGDQPKQLYRYHSYNKDAIILYLTKYGDEPSEESTNEQLEKDKEYFCISYQDHINKWIEICMKKVESNHKIRESLNNYKSAVDEITFGGSMNNDIVSQIVKSKESIEAAFLINKSIVSCSIQEVLIKKLTEQLQQKAKQLKYEYSVVEGCGELGSDESEIAFVKKKRQDGLYVSIGFDKKFSEFFIGVSDNSVHNSIKNKIKGKRIISRVQNKIGKNATGYKNYYYLHRFVGERLGDWTYNAEIWIGILDGNKTADELFKMIEFISDSICDVEI